MAKKRSTKSTPEEPKSQVDPVAEPTTDEGEETAHDAGEASNESNDAVDTPEDELREQVSLQETEITVLKAQVDLLNSQLEETKTALDSAKSDIDYAKAETRTAITRGREDESRAVKRTKRDLISKLINVADVFQQTKAQLEQLDDEEKSAVMPTAVQLAIKEFDKRLAAEGLEVLDPGGEKFDPAFHEAQTTIPVPDAEPDSVLEVLRLGYLLDGTVLRAAQVVVVAKPSPTPESDAAEES